jgi:homoserine O-acetyltransferase/O-succinyltransferase
VTQIDFEEERRMISWPAKTGQGQLSASHFVAGTAEEAQNGGSQCRFERLIMTSMSTELIEESVPDVGPRSVGLVRTQSATLFAPPNELTLANSRHLGPITVAYETYGKLSSDRDNAIFVCHALTGDAHAAGYRSKEEFEARKAGWWDGFIGPGKGLDTDKYFVICANALGGCQGTTGPSSISPDTGEPWGPDFPVIQIPDIVDVHAELVGSLGIERLLSVVGGSLGGMQVLEWAARYPERLASAVVLASAPRMSAQGIAFNAVGRNAIFNDPNYKDGRYYGNSGPRTGLALARMVAHITYLSEESIERKFGRKLQDIEALAFDLLKETEFQVESYLNYQGRRFVERFDANSYLYLTKAMDYYDLAQSYGSLEKAFAASPARFLVVSYDSDWLYPTRQSKEIVGALIAAGKHASFIELHSAKGHDTFLIEIDQLEALARPFLDRTLEEVRAAAAS